MENERMLSIAVLYDYALKHVGLPYRWGGNNALAGYDCSGLVCELLESVGILPFKSDLGSQALFDHFSSDPADPAPTFGTLVFFGSPIDHVGFCLNDKIMLEAGGGDHTTVDRATAEKQGASIRIRPISYRKALVGFRKPVYPWKG